MKIALVFLSLTILASAATLSDQNSLPDDRSLHHHLSHITHKIVKVVVKVVEVVAPLINMKADGSIQDLEDEHYEQIVKETVKELKFQMLNDEM